MSTIYTNTYLRTLSRTKTLTESRKMFSAQSEPHTSFDIFLSHSYLDKEDVEGLYIELTRMGFKVYVDWIIDPNLDRTNVTKATATIIQNRLKCSKALLLAISGTSRCGARASRRCRPGAVGGRAPPLRGLHEYLFYGLFLYLFQLQLHKLHFQVH